MMTGRIALGLLWLWGANLGESAGGAEFRTHQERVVIGADEVIEGDLYVFARAIVVEGTVRGDLVAAGEDVAVTGVVEGDVIAAGRTVLVDGRVLDDARIAGQVLKVSKRGYLGGDMIAAGYSLECETGSEVAADVVMAGAQALLSGRIGRDLTVHAANCALEGQVGRNASIEAGGTSKLARQRWIDPGAIKAPDVPAGFTAGPAAKVAGKLTYQAAREAEISQPDLAGSIEYRPMASRQARAPALKDRIVAHAAAVAPLVVFGLLVVLLVPGWMREMADTIRYRPVASFLGSLIGALVFAVVVVIVLAVMGMAAAAFGAAKMEAAAAGSVFVGLLMTSALVVGWLFVLGVLAPAIASTAVGRLITRADAIPTLVSFLVGLVILILLTWIPVAGPIVGLVMLAVGVGAFCVWFFFGPPPESLETVQPGK